jgi:hypothetical protein
VAPPEDGGFSRQKLTFPVCRRALFGAIVSGARRGPDCAPGRPAFALDTLGEYPDDRLAVIVPVIVEGHRLAVVQGWVCTVTSPEGTPSRLLPATPAVLAIVEAVDGRRNLAGIRARAERVLGDGAVVRFGQVRDVFLTLVVNRAALPVGAAPGAEGEEARDAREG